MKRVLSLLLLASSATFAASWDGQRGPFQVFAFTQPGFLPGVPGVSPSAPPLTIMWLNCSDPAITAVRARIQYHDDNGDHESMVLANFVKGRGIIVTQIPEKQITGMPMTALLDGDTY